MKETKQCLLSPPPPLQPGALLPPRPPSARRGQLFLPAAAAHGAEEEGGCGSSLGVTPAAAIPPALHRRSSGFARLDMKTTAHSLESSGSDSGGLPPCRSLPPPLSHACAAHLLWGQRAAAWRCCYKIG